ncbi:MAG: hypothetical protein HWN67_00320 [Candidatus Helarchaeota archaeon]|nr:hypothetical protein [Candidatus Helarchaeota archaeon]
MAEAEKDLEKVRSELKELVDNYTKVLRELPLVDLESANYDLESIINNLKDKEDEMRKSEDDMNNFFQTTLKMLELRVNSNILHQHFIGCLNVASNCEDLMCFKIFMSQAYTAYLQQLTFVKKFLEIFNEININDLIKQLKFFETNIEVLKSFDSRSQQFLDKMDKMVQDLNEKTKELPTKLY